MLRLVSKSCNRTNKCVYKMGRCHAEIYRFPGCDLVDNAIGRCGSLCALSR